MGTTRVIRRFRLLRDVIFGTPNTGDVAQYDSGTDRIVVEPLAGEHVTVTPFASIAAGNVQDALEEVVAEATGAIITDHGGLSGLGDDDHAQYLKEKASGGAASEIPVHDHSGTAQAGTIDHGALTGLGDNDHPQYQLAATAATDAELAAAIAASEAGQVRDGDAAAGVLGGTYPNPSFAVDMATQAELDAHVNDATAAHAASAISVDSTDLDGTGTDLQTVLEELEDQIDAAAGGGGPPTGAAGGVLDGTYPNPGLAASVAGDGLAEAANVLSVNVDDSTIEIDTDTLQVKDGGITPGKLSFDPATQAELDAHLSDATDAHVASSISVIPAGGLAADDVQEALEELDSEFADHSARHEVSGDDEMSIAGLSGVPVELQAHLDDASDAHDASAISILDAAGDFAATDVEGALAELQADAEADATALSDHIADATDAHAGTAITNTPAGNIAATTLQAAINELDTEKQPLDSDLTAIAALTPTNDDILQRKAGAWTNRTMAQLIADLAALGTTFQALDATLTALAGQNWAANAVPVGSGADTLSQVALAANKFLARASTGNLVAKDITDFALSLLDDADAATARATLGVVATLFQNGGTEELSVAGLNGELADAQPVTVRKNTGADVGTRSRLNFIEGSNVTLTVADDSGSDEVDITIAASGSGSSDMSFVPSFLFAGA